MEGPLPIPVINYFHNPTLQNAKFLLAAYELNLPTHEDGGNKRACFARFTREARGGAYASEARIHALSRLDVLHDLKHDRIPLENDVIDFVLNDAGLTAEEHVNVVKTCENPRANVTKTFAAMMGQSTKSKRLIATKWHEMGPTLEIVLDGVLEQIREPLTKQDHQKFTKSMCLHAFVMGVFDSPTSNLERIVFLYGVFQYMDIAGWKGFVNRWRMHLNTQVKALVEIQYISPDSIQPYSHKFKVKKSAVFINDIKVPIQHPKRGNNSQGVMAFFKSDFGVTYDKAYLKEIFNSYMRLDAADKVQYLPFMKLVMDVNFFRDAYKADVALSRKALYLTFDRLAFVYYKMRCELEGSTMNGLFYCVNGVGTCEVSDC